MRDRRCAISIDFPGTDEYIDCGSGATLDNITAGDISLSAWVNADSLGATLTALMSKWGASGGWIFYPLASVSNKIHLQVHRPTSAGIWYSAGALGTGTWTHVAVTYNGSSTANDPIFYINGTLSATTESTTPSGALASDADGSLYLGRYSTYYLDGKMEDVRVFNRILAGQEVAILAGGYRGPLGGEVGWWMLDTANAITHWDGANLTVNTNYIPDLSGNANTGNPTGTPLGIGSTCPRVGGIID